MTANRTELLPMKDRPLVTFAVFAYNQERYIRQAIEGALAQDYSPLEIILSDDCSSDRTFDIMQEMASSYRGPHKVRVNRPLKNLGTLAHVISVAHLARGKIFVVAAGDDISLPHRVDSIYKFFKEGGFDALYSSSRSIGDDDREIYVTTVRKRTNSAVNPEERIELIHGATAAYRKSLITSIPLPVEPIIHEDVFFSTMVHLRGGKLGFVNDPLILYRRTLGKSTFKQLVEDIISQEKRKIVRVSYYLKLLKFSEFCLRTGALTCEGKDLPRSFSLNSLSKSIAEHEAMEMYFELRGVPRALGVFRMIKHGKGQWGAARIFGIRIYAYLAALKRSLSASLNSRF